MIMSLDFRVSNTFQKLSVCFKQLRRFCEYNNSKVDISQVAQDFLPFGSVDVKLMKSSQVIVSVSHRKRYMVLFVV